LALLLAPLDDHVDATPKVLRAYSKSRDPRKQQRIFGNLLEMAVRALDRTVFTRQTPIVAGRRHTVIRAKRLVAGRLVLSRVLAKITEPG
jgi:hypothetical protein